MTVGTTPQEVPCAHCNGTGKVMLPAEIDTLEIYYFGCWQEAGHYWRGFNGHHATTRDIESRLPQEMHRGHIDCGYCPGYAGPHKRDRGEVEGEAKLTHVDGWTVLGWWDRSIDGRGGCNSNIVAKGLHDFTTMMEIGKRRIPQVMKRQKQPIVLVEDKTK